MHVESILVLLFTVATAVAIAARRFRMPYTVALVVAGLGLGSTHAIQAPHLTKALLFAVFLPGLIFEAAFHLEWQDFRRNRLAILTLAVPGVLAAILLTALILAPTAADLEAASGFDWRHALVFGSLIAATDPIAVIGLFRTMGVPRRLSALLEGESLLNDGTAIVFFSLLLAALAGERVSAPQLGMDFVTVVGIGALTGVVIGLSLSKLTQMIDDPMIEITLTTIAAYGSFAAAEQLHASGVIATVVAGMLCGNYGARTGMSASTRVAVETFWEYIAFALNSIVFLLIGLEVRLEGLLAAWQPIVIAYLAVTFARVIVVMAVSGLLSRTRERLPASWSFVLTWGGLRGGLSMVLVLSLPLQFPGRDLLISTTFGVVILSILIQGLTMAPLLRRMGIVRAHETHLAHDAQRAGLQATLAGLTELERVGKARSVAPDVLAAVKVEYEVRAGTAEDRIRELHLARRELHEDEFRRLRRQLLLVEKENLVDNFHRGGVGREAFQRVLADIDARLLRVESEGEPHS